MKSTLLARASAILAAGRALFRRLSGRSKEASRQIATLQEKVTALEQRIRELERARTNLEESSGSTQFSEEVPARPAITITLARRPSASPAHHWSLAARSLRLTESQREINELLGRLYALNAQLPFDSTVEEKYIAELDGIVDHLQQASGYDLTRWLAISRPRPLSTTDPIATGFLCLSDASFSAAERLGSLGLPTHHGAPSYAQPIRSFCYSECGDKLIVSSTIASAPTTKRVFNFNAGPAALPLSVLERIREELLDWRGSGMSVMEMSHRSPEFESISAAAEQKLRSLLAVPDGYAVIFLQGGGSLQFTMAPMNLCLPGKPVDVLHTGAWTAKAIGELKKGFLYNIAASTESEKFARLPRADEIKLTPDASYLHICTNNTIEGTQWTAIPETGGVPLVADMSSDIASHPIDVKKFGLIFAGAQKNLGPSGVTIVIVRKDLTERADKNLPALLQYRTHMKEKSLYHTPPTFAVYVVGLVLEWIESLGGIAAIQKRNEAKAKLLYDTIEASGGFYRCPVEPASRSKMNVVFRVAGGNEAVEKQFAQEATLAGLAGTPGHRSVGGMRISLYNAVPLDAVEALTSFMREFQRTRG